jgi:hypothetical protein
MAKLVLPLMLLEAGYPVILTDIDTYWVREPTSYLTSLGVDFAAMNDNCPNTLNSGFVYYSGSAKSKRVLQNSLFHKEVKNNRYSLFSDNDQYLLNCGHAYAFAYEGLKSMMLPRPGFQFGGQVEGFVNFKCASTASQSLLTDKNTSAAMLPYVFHTTGTSGGTVIDTVKMLKAVGFWDVKTTGQGFCVDGVRESSAKSQQTAKQMGQEACKTRWHPRCNCKEFWADSDEAPAHQWH